MDHGNCRKSLSHLAQAANPAAGIGAYLEETADDHEKQRCASELVREIQLAVDALRLEYKTVFVLFHEQDQPYEDIARTMRRPVGTDQNLAASRTS